MIPKVQIYIEVVALGAGKAGRVAGCAILTMGAHRKVIAQYAGIGVTVPVVVKGMTVESINQLKTLCDVSVLSSSAEPRGLAVKGHSFAWRRISEGSAGWQMRAAAAAWETALCGAVTTEILELAATAPIEPVGRGMFLYGSTWA
jgi:hypothetical protein